MNNLCKTAQHFFAVVIFGLASSASSAAEQCPAINCDCDYLPSETWVQACSEYESYIKKECAANFDTPKDYCLLHGVNAAPVALALGIDPSASAKRADKSANEYIDAYVRTLESAFAVVDQSLNSGDYSQAMDGLKLMDEASRKQFVLQQTLIWGDAGEIKRLWKEYSPLEEKTAARLKLMAERLEKDYNRTTSERSKKVFRVLLVKNLRIQGLMYEHSAFAENWLEKPGESAKLWKNSADTSLRLIELAKESGSAASDIRFNEIQAAARLQQASLFWQKDNELKTVVENLDKSAALLGKSSKLEVGPIIQENTKAMAKRERRVNTTLECISGKNPRLCK